MSLTPSREVGHGNTIPSLIDSQAIRFGSRVAIREASDNCVSYAELANSVAGLVGALRGLGVCQNSRLALALPNGIDHAVGLLSTCSAAVAVPLSAELHADEYRSYFRTAHVTHLLTSADAPPTARRVAWEMGLAEIMLVRKQSWQIQSTLPQTKEHAAKDTPTPTDTAVILMTSGSTGQPKRVPLTHQNLCIAAASVAKSLHLDALDRCLVMWEQHHIGGLVDLLLAPLMSGSSVTFSGGFDAKKFFDLIAAVNPTWFQGVPTTLRELLRHGRLAGRLPLRNSRLRLLRSVAAPLPGEVMVELEEAFGVPVIQTFGMTEASPLITTNRLPPDKRVPNSAGTPCGCEVAVMDGTGSRLPAGVTGEIAIRGENVFTGYEDDDEANLQSFRNGWFYTGDLGYLDGEGFLFLTGRAKELINRGGEKVAPVEIEEVLIRHPAVDQAAAFPVPHMRLGEDVGVAIITKGGCQTSQNAIREFVAQHLSKFKVPSVVLFLDHLPRCPIGKVRRRELTSMAIDQQVLMREKETKPSTGDDPAEDSLEKRLAELWALHLDVPHVDLKDDFRLLGGDSLAQIRLLLAVESLFKVEFPEHEERSITTVRKMAAEIRRCGGRVPMDSGERCDADRRLLGNVEVCSNLSDADTTSIRNRLSQSRSLSDFRAAREALINTMTLEELWEVLSNVEFRPPGLVSKLRRIPWNALRSKESLDEYRRTRTVENALQDWRRSVETAIRRDPSHNWSRQRLENHIYHYRQKGLKAADRSLIIAFAGNHMRLMLPTHAILAHLGRPFDLILLGDATRRHFADGIPGVANDISELCDWLRSATTPMGYQSMRTFGTSAGGLAAICCGYALECHHVAAIGADSPTAHPVLSEFLRLQVRGANHPEVVLGYSESNRRDRKAAQDINSLLPNGRFRIMRSDASHNSLQPALKTGRLRELLSELLYDSERHERTRSA